MKRPPDRPPNQTKYGETLVPLTLNVAKRLAWNMELYHATQKDSRGWPVKARVNANQARTWLRSPERVSVPMKYGLRTCFYVTEFDLGSWTIPEALAKKLEEDL